MENVYKDERTAPIVELLKESALQLDNVIKRIVFDTRDKP